MLGNVRLVLFGLALVATTGNYARAQYYYPSGYGYGGYGFGGWGSTPKGGSNSSSPRRRESGARSPRGLSKAANGRSSAAPGTR